MANAASFYRQLRESVGTIPEVARLLGVHRRTIVRREQGAVKITEEMVAALEFFKSKENE